MPQTVRFRLDEAAVGELSELRARLRARGIPVPTDVPAVIAAAAAAIPPRARTALGAELATVRTSEDHRHMRA